MISVIVTCAYLAYVKNQILNTFYPVIILMSKKYGHINNPNQHWIFPPEKDFWYDWSPKYLEK